MAIPYLRTGCLLLTAGMVACGGGAPRSGQETKSTPIPLTVIVEKVISGEILHKTLKGPAGLACDREGQLYLIDQGNYRIVRFNSELVPASDVGGFGGQPDQFSLPEYVCVDNSLSLVVSDPGNQRLARLDANLHYYDEISLVDDEDPFKYRYPTGVAVTKYGELWMADKDANRVAVFNNAGIFDRFIGDFGYEGGNLSSPEKIVWLPPDRFVVFDAGNTRVVIYDDYGSVRRKIQSKDWAYPNAGTIDADGRLWVVDGGTARLFCFSMSGKQLFVAGPQLAGNDIPLNRPHDIATLPDGRLVISDTGNNRLLICSIIQDKS